jgi:chemotaxis protein histidine kinase CheA
MDWMTELEDELNKKTTAEAAPVETPEEAAPAETPAEAPVEAQAEAQDSTPVTAESEAPAEAPAAEASEPAEPAAAPKHKEPFIPKSRLDEEIDKRRKLEEELTTAKDLVRQFLTTAQQQQAQQAQAQQAKQPEEDPLDTLADLEHQALLEGDVDKAKFFRRKANQIMMEQAQAKAYQASQQQFAVSSEDYQFQTRLQQITQEHPEFDQTSPLYDEQLTNMALTIGQGLMTQGVRKGEILDRVLNVLSPVLSARAKPAAQEPQPQPLRPVAEKVAAAKAQPPSTNSAGSAPRGEAKYDFSSMTIEDFERLPQDEINRILRRM